MLDAMKSVFQPYMDWATDRLGSLLFLGGLTIVIVALLASHGFALSREAITTFAVTVGTALISGGFFAWLTKVAQLRGVFRKDLERIIYCREHVLVRKDAQQLWAGVTRALHNDSFKDIEEKIYTAIQSAYLPTNKDFYYKDAKRKAWIKLIDRAAKIIEIEIQFSAVLVADRSKENVTRRYKLQMDESSVALQTPLLRCQLLDRLTDDLIAEATATTSADDPTKLECKLEVESRRDVKVSDHLKYRQRLDLDNVLVWKAASYVDGLEIELNYDPQDIQIQHSPIGNVKFRYIEHPRPGLLTIATGDLIFAGLGLIISLQVREEPIMRSTETI